MKSLADALGTNEPLTTGPEEPAADAPFDARTFSCSILQSKEYREALLRRIVTDTLPAAIEIRLYDYAAGKPTDHLEVKDTTYDTSGVPNEEIARRVKLLQDTIHHLRTRANTEQVEPGTVH